MGLFNPQRREEQARYVYCENERFQEILRENKRKGAVALSPTKKTNRSLPKGIERFAAFVYNRIAKNHQQESEDIIPQ